MTTQSVMTQAANLAGTAAGTTASKGKQTGKGFNLIMESSLKTATSLSSNTSTAASDKTSKTAADNDSSTKSDDLSSTDTSKGTVQKLSSQTTQTSKTADQKTDTASGNSKVSDTEPEQESVQDNQQAINEILAQISAMLQQVQEAAMKALNLSPEEFNQLLTSQGMSAIDLLQPENLQQLVLANSGQSDILAALTDENLANTINQLIQNVNTIQSESNLGLTTEQMKSILTQADTGGTAQSQTIAEMILSQDQTTAPQEAAAKAETVKSTDTTANAKDNLLSKAVTENTAQTNTVTSSAASETSNTGSQTADSDTDRNLGNSDQFQNIIDNLVKASQNKQTEIANAVDQVADLREIATQIIERIKVSVSSDQTSMELQLNPESLGKVNLSVQSKDGVLTAHFVVQNEISKEAIESQIHTLRDTLNNQGIKVEAIEVTVSANAFDQNSSKESNGQADTQKNPSGKQITLEEALNMSEVTEDDSSADSILGDTGSLIDYTA